MSAAGATGIKLSTCPSMSQILGAHTSCQELPHSMEHSTNRGRWKLKNQLPWWHWDWISRGYASVLHASFNVRLNILVLLAPLSSNTVQNSKAPIIIERTSNCFSVQTWVCSPKSTESLSQKSRRDGEKRRRSTCAGRKYLQKTDTEEDHTDVIKSNSTWGFVLINYHTPKGIAAWVFEITVSSTCSSLHRWTLTKTSAEANPHNSSF